MCCRSSCGACSGSPSSRRAWIEICPARMLCKAIQRSPSSRRAWIEILINAHSQHGGWSPSSRRAWIEIEVLLPRLLLEKVALLAEGVDRNQTLLLLLVFGERSPSSRRAWIEIVLFLCINAVVVCRPPRGGRG